MSKKHTTARGRPCEGWLLLVGLTLGLITAQSPARACDLCAIYTTIEVGESKAGFRIGVAEQFTRFGTLQRGGEKIANPFDEYMNSSITQLVLGYNFTGRLGLQLNVPFISRTFRRVTTTAIDRGDETGPGDLSLIGTVNAYSTYSENSLFRISLFGGLELPSGDPDRLAGGSGGGPSRRGRSVAGLLSAQPAVPARRAHLASAPGTTKNRQACRAVSMVTSSPSVRARSTASSAARSSPAGGGSSSTERSSTSFAPRAISTTNMPTT